MELNQDIIKHKKLEDEQIQSLLQEDITDHLFEVCDCDKDHGLCYAGQWVLGQLDNKTVLEDYYRRTI